MAHGGRGWAVTAGRAAPGAGKEPQTAARRIYRPRVQRGGLGCSSHWPDGGAMWGGGRPTPAEPRECCTLPPWCWRPAHLIPPVAGGEESRDGHRRPRTGRALRASDF